MRAVWMEVFYDGSDEPSISVPCLDFFGVPHRRPVLYSSAVMTMQEGKGFNSYLPMPFQKRIRIELTNSSLNPIPLYYQVNYTPERSRARWGLPARYLESSEPDGPEGGLHNP